MIREAQNDGMTLLLLALWCRRGRHRSVAVADILMILLQECAEELHIEVS